LRTANERDEIYTKRWREFGDAAGSRKVLSQGGSRMKRLLATAGVAAMLGAGLAYAGEVKGPPNTLNNTNDTAAPTHANSNCAYSGLNDFDTTDPMGQLSSQVQTAADSWRFAGLPHGAPGLLGLCQGGTNESRQ
jgi:hypothetical protein